MFLGDFKLESLRLMNQQIVTETVNINEKIVLYFSIT